MGVIRITKHEAPYVMLDKTALKDKRLSFRAKGLHAYLMSKPDDWHINSEHLAALSPKEGREAIMMAMRELRNNGYTRRVTQRDEKGHLLGSDIIVYETPWLAEQDAADQKLIDAVKDIVNPALEPSSPKNGLADNRENRESDKPKVGLTESRLDRKSANPQLLMNVNTQRNETTKEDEKAKDAFSSPELAQPDAHPVEDTPAPRAKKVPKSQQPGELHPNTIDAVQNMMVNRFHLLAEPTKDNEVFWDAQIAYLQEANAISFTACLKKVDAYWSSNPDKVAMKAPGLRKQMRKGIEIEVEKAQRAMKGTRRYG